MRCRVDPIEKFAVARRWTDNQVKVGEKSRMAALGGDGIVLEGHIECQLVGTFVCLIRVVRDDSVVGVRHDSLDPRVGDLSQGCVSSFDDSVDSGTAGVKAIGGLGGIDHLREVLLG